MTLIGRALPLALLLSSAVPLADAHAAKPAAHNKRDQTNKRSQTDCDTSTKVVPPPQAQEIENDLGPSIRLLHLAGNGVTGRGNGSVVFLRDGSLRFLDSLKDEELKQIVPPPKVIPGFDETCSNESFSQFSVDPETMNELTNLLKDQIVPKYGFEFAKALALSADEFQSVAKMSRYRSKKAHPDWSKSTRLNEAQQSRVLSLDFANGGYPIIYEPLYRRLSAKDRAGVILRAGLRYMAMTEEKPEVLVTQFSITRVHGKDSEEFEEYQGIEKAPVQNLMPLETLDQISQGLIRSEDPEKTRKILKLDKAKELQRFFEVNQPTLSKIFDEDGEPKSTKVMATSVAWLDFLPEIQDPTELAWVTRLALLMESAGSKSQKPDQTVDSAVVLGKWLRQHLKFASKQKDLWSRIEDGKKLKDHYTDETQAKLESQGATLRRALRTEELQFERRMQREINLAIYSKGVTNAPADLRLQCAVMDTSLGDDPKQRK